MSRFRFQPGRNCWRVQDTRRLAVLVDGESYFAAFRRALIAARRRVFILAWDIDSRMELVREDPADGLPTRLGDLLKALLDAEPLLHVHLLLWDYAPIYALEREPLFFGDSPWDRHPRLHFAVDNVHPLAASHHQKVVCVDRRIAFCGGLDLSKWRWDTNAHLAQDPRRIDADGKPYPPFHDVQMLVDGDAAAALEDLCLTRWRRATGEALAHVDDGASDGMRDPWPEDILPLLQNRPCAIARTLPAHRGQKAVSEVARLYSDMIGSAERFIYAENQYLSASVIREALARSLRQRRGPEVLLILPQETGAWLEQHTMDLLRARLLPALREADRHGRLRLYYPTIPGLGDDRFMVHAKLMIVDDRILRIGSSNLSNRSMGLDTECDLCVEARDESSRAALRGLRRRLLGILLGRDAETVAEAESQEGGLIAAIESLRRDGRTLAPLRGEADPEWLHQLPDSRLIDPDQPLDAEHLSNTMLGDGALPLVRRRLWLGAALVVALLAFAAAWRWTGLADWLEPQTVAGSLTSALRGPWGLLLLAALFVAGSLIAVPITLLILVTVLVYGPIPGTLYALGGSLLAAVTTYALGHRLGRPAVESLSGARIARLNARLAERGILAIVTLRVVPVAPFTVINLFAGASRIRLRDYVIGTLIGMLPGIAAMAVFAEGISAFLADLDIGQFVVALLALVFVAGLALFARRLFLRPNRRAEARDPPD